MLKELFMSFFIKLFYEIIDITFNVKLPVTHESLSYKNCVMLVNVSNNCITIYSEYHRKILKVSK